VSYYFLIGIEAVRYFSFLLTEIIKDL